MHYRHFYERFFILFSLQYLSIFLVTLNRCFFLVSSPGFTDDEAYYGNLFNNGKRLSNLNFLEKGFPDACSESASYRLCFN